MDNEIANDWPFKPFLDYVTDEWVTVYEYILDRLH